MHFKVVIHSEAGGGCWAEVPSLPGCYAQGETKEELLGHLKEAIEGVLEVMHEEGREPENADVQIMDLVV